MRLQRGETLVGLLVGLAVGLLVLAGAAQLMAQLLRGQRLALQDAHAQQDLQWALELVARELQNAQYVHEAWRSRGPGACRDAFCDGPEDLRVAAGRLDFSLDRNHNGRQDNDECTGLRLSAGALQLRTACSPEVWTPLTDTSVLRVQRLEARLDCQGQGGWLQRRVRLNAEAQVGGPAGRSLLESREVALHNALPEATRALFCP